MSWWPLKVEKNHFILLVALVLAIAFRLFGIRWGLPDAAHPDYSYHPDEMLHLVFARKLAAGEMLGKQFIYGGTIYYTILNAYFYYADRLGEILGGFNHLANTILVGRYFHTALSIISILIVYRIGRAFFGAAAGAFAAAMLAIAPADILCAQRMRPDEMGAFLTVVIIALSWRIISTDEKNGFKPYISAGLVLGVATACRFPLAIMVGAPVTAHILVNCGKKTADVFRSLFDKRLTVMLGAIILGYAISSPHTFIYPEWFMQGMRIQWYYQSSPFLDAVDAGPGVYQYGWKMLHEALGYPLYFLALGGVVLALIKRSRADLVILAAVVPYFILTTFTSWVVVRYTLPLLPLLAMLAGRFVVYLAEEMPRYRLALYGVATAALAWTMLADYAFFKMEAGKDVRDVTAEWIQQNIPRGSSIATVRVYFEDYYFNPVISSKDYSAPVFFLSDRNDSQAFFKNYKFDYLVLHEVIYKNMERLGQRHPYLQYRIFYESLVKSHYKIIKEFKQPIKSLGIDFSSWFTSQDYVITDPEIRVYQYQS